jgi:hypothetical protein
MPRPPFLPLIDWPSVFAGGLEWNAWLALAEFPEKRDSMAHAALTLQPPDDGIQTLDTMTRPIHVVAVAEDWCGDVVKHAPVLQLIALRQPLIRVRFVARHDHPDMFVRFLTNGGEAIPRFVFLSETFVECGNWGPMPEEHRRWIARGKACNDLAAARQKVNQLYEADPQRHQAFRELADLAALAATTEIK